MKKKILLLMGLIFILCGCSAEVNIDIDGNTIKEDVSIEAFANEYLTKEQLSTAFRTYIPAFSKDTIVDTMPDTQIKGISYYDRTLKDLGTGYRFTYKYNFNLNNYLDSRTVKEGFKSASINTNKKDKTLLFSTDKGELMYFNQYPELDEVRVNIRTAYEVKEDNADYKDGNVYTWVFSRGSSKNIYLLLNTEDPENDKDNNNQNQITQIKKDDNESEVVAFLNKHPFLIVILSLILFIIVVLIVSRVTKIKYR